MTSIKCTSLFTLLQIRVFCRVRPSPRSVISYLPDGLSVKLQVEGKEHPFSYDKVFKSESTQVSM